MACRLYIDGKIRHVYRSEDKLVLTISTEYTIGNAVKPRWNEMEVHVLKNELSLFPDIEVDKRFCALCWLHHWKGKPQWIAYENRSKAAIETKLDRRVKNENNRV